MIEPTAYAHHTLRSENGLSVILNNVLTGESIAVNGTAVECWKGRKGITVRGYDERTGKYTGTVKHLSTDTTKFIGVIARGWVVGGENYTMAQSGMREVFGQNV